MINRDKPRSARWILGVVLCMVPALPAAGQATDTVDRGPRQKLHEFPRTRFEFDHLEAQAAQLMVLEFCAEQPPDTCQLLSLGSERTGGEITVVGTPGATAEIGRLLAQKDALGSTQRIQVAVIEATKEGRREISTLSDGAREALEDAASLLPFAGLTVLDVALIETSHRASTRVLGPGGFSYDLTLFMLPVVGTEGPKLVFDRFVVVRPSQEGADGQPVQATEMLEATFEIAVGETVVVGTSRLNGGDSALIVLVTVLTDSDS